MNNRLIRLAVAIALFSGHFAANAYELSTHARMTYKAYDQSVLKKDDKLIKDLGIDLSNPDNPFGIQYYDISGSDVRARDVTPFEEGFMTERSDNPNPAIPTGTDPLSLPGWLMRGAIREDDYAQAFGVWVAPNPQNDTDLPEAFWRVMNHFYDPVYNRPLTLSAVQAGAFSLATDESTDFHTAPNWATGAQDAFAQSPVPEEGRRNHFTVFDAREAMYRALTGKSKNNQDAAPTKDDRNKYWATLFRALGDIVHLIQDMGQPQHTRNDMHSGVRGFGHESIYEKYLDCRATGDRFEAIDNYQDFYLDSCYPLTYAGYLTPVFTRYRDYFATRDGTGRGLAEYSNRNFFTFGTNLGSNDYPSPSNDRSLYDEETFLRFDSLGFHRTVRFLRGNVTDTRTGETNNVRLTTESAFDYFLGTSRNYSLNVYNYDDQADLLIPRAVAYSAGLIDYFFRGRLSAADVGFNNEAVTLRVVNAIDTKKYPDFQNEQLYAGGKLVVTREYTVSNEKRLEASDAVVLAEDIAPGKTSESSYTFNFPAALPDGVASIKFRLVFRGRLGQEAEAVAAGAIRPHVGFVVTPYYAPADGLDGTRHIYQYAGRWMLSDETGLLAGNIDWKGWYVNGKPTRTLSWYGPKARYFPNWHAPTTGDGPFTPQIFQNGELYALAPSAVLGAALMKDANNLEWVVAVCKEGDADVVYRRPNKKGDSPALYDPVANPEGWQEIGRFSGGSSAYWEADRPWFFNGVGTAALTMRWGNTDGGVKLNRLTATIGDVAEIKPAANTAIQINGSRSRICDGNGGYGTYTTSSSGSSAMDIAVDYRDTEPMVATYSVDDANGSYIFSEIFSGSTFTRRVEFQPNHTEKISISGGPSVIISSTTGTRKTVSTCDTTCSTVASSSIVDTWRYIQYMDLRTGFISTWTQVVSEQVADSSDPAYSAGGELLSVLLTAQSDQKMNHAGNVIEVNTNPAGNVTTLVNNLSPDRPKTVVELLGRTASVVQTNGDVAYFQMYNANNLPGQDMQCGSTLSNNYTDAAASYASYSVPNDIGHWAISSDNKLISVMAIKDYSPYANTTKNFSYLSEGNLGQIIPTAPDNPWYYNIGVIH